MQPERTKGAVNRVFRPRRLTNLVTLKDFCISVQRGEFIGILGDVGSGKSSIISMLIGDLLYMEKDYYKVFRSVGISEFLIEKI